MPPDVGDRLNDVRLKPIVAVGREEVVDSASHRKNDGHRYHQTNNQVAGNSRACEIKFFKNRAQGGPK